MTQHPLCSCCNRALKNNRCLVCEAQQRLDHMTQTKEPELYYNELAQAAREQLEHHERMLSEQLLSYV